MSFVPEDLIRQIHVGDGRVVLAVSGGGSQAIGHLLATPGASRTVLEAIVPYSEPAMLAWLGGRPDQACSHRTARAMAMAAFRRACDYVGQKARPAGIACTASLASDRPKRGPHRAHLAMQTASRTATWSVQLEKDRRTRAEEEQVIAQILINVVAEACGVEGRVNVELLDSESLESSETVAPAAWQDLLLGHIEAVGRAGRDAGAVFPGAFNPWHDGHRRILQIAQDILGQPVSLEISILNVEKPPLDYLEIKRRVDQFPEDQPLVLTRSATFVEKSRLFPGTTFVVGSDTIRRIAAPRYYGDNSSACQAALQRIVDRGCHFLVFGRNMGTGFVRLSDLDLPEMLQAVCREIPPEKFREDISSTELRKSGVW